MFWRRLTPVMIDIYSIEKGSGSHRRTSTLRLIGGEAVPGTAAPYLRWELTDDGRQFPAVLPDERPFELTAVPYLRSGLTAALAG